MRMLYFLAALALVQRSSAAAEEATTQVHVPPLFRLSDLRNGRRSGELAGILSTTGLLQVSLDGDDDSYSHSQLLGNNNNNPEQHPLESLCRCSHALSLEVPGVESVVLADDRTTRTTLGTATIGNQPLPLPSELASVCGTDAAAALEAIRDDVSVAAFAFQVAWDRLLLDAAASQRQTAAALLRNTNGISYGSIKDISMAANHLEHFHVYTKDGSSHVQDVTATTSLEEQRRLALDWHTDAGLFLAFVPAHGCDSNNNAQDRSFFIMDPTDNQQKVVAFDPSAVTIMLGMGAEQWLDTSMNLRAARHAVHMRPGQSRAWYGMMQLVPESAIIQASPERTFGDMRRNMIYAKDHVHPDTDIVSIGCGHEHVDPLASSSLSAAVTTNDSTRTERRRLQHVQSGEACNNSTNFFCWMQCLEIPNYKQAQGYLNEGYSLYCLDPATLEASSNRVSAATEPCQNGFVHNAYCSGSWQPTAPGVTAIPVVTDSSSQASSSSNEQWCYGATSMYMDGFHWRSTVCIIYLFPSWILSSQGKVAGASIGTLAFGVALEKTIHHRRLVTTMMKPGYNRLAASTILYGIQLTMGYLLMLIIMTYSGPLFLCVVLGLMGGHVLFNAKDALLIRGEGCPSTNNTECVEECPQDCRTEDDPEMIKRCPCEQVVSEEEQHHHAGVPEGITPCCQNTL